jgi:hypothetical protein
MNWELVYNLESSWHQTFNDAFVALWTMSRAGTKGLSWQGLETTVWIKHRHGKPISFYDARDKAHEIGLLKNGKPMWV